MDVFDEGYHIRWDNRIPDSGAKRENGVEFGKGHLDRISTSFFMSRK